MKQVTLPVVHSSQVGKGVIIITMTMGQQALRHQPKVNVVIVTEPRVSKVKIDNVGNDDLDI